MKVMKWVDVSQEVEVTIGADDIRIAMAEAFSVVTTDRLGEEGPNRNDVLIAFNQVAQFLNALTDQQIDELTTLHRSTVWAFLLKAAERFAPPLVSA